MRRAKMVGAVLTLFMALSNAQQVGAGEPPEPEAAFSRLSALAGSWKRAGTDGTMFRIEFELTANDTVLVERWVHRDKTHSLTLYHLDGPALMATHYCPQGNQPRLRMERGGDGKRISFDFQDATNLKSADQSHQHRLSFDLADMERVIRGEAYRQGGTSKDSEMALVRIP